MAIFTTSLANFSSLPNDDDIVHMTNQIPLLVGPTVDHLFPHSYEQFCGSSHGWLAAMKFSGRVSLFNPLSSTTSNDNKSVIGLPRFPYNDNTKDYKVKKFILYCDPRLNANDYVVVVSHDKPGSLSYIKPSRDESWTPVKTQNGCSFLDFIYYKNHVYVLNFFGRLETIDIEDGNRTREVIVKPRLMRSFMNHYIVEASDGGLLMVQRVCDKRWISKSFSIFKLTETSSEGVFEWVEVDGLGSDALLLGDNGGVCVVASNSLACQPNCIYFSTNCYNRDMGRLDAGIYRLNDKSIDYV